MHQIRQVLDRAGYTEKNLRSLFGVGEWPVYRQRRRELPLYLWRTRGGSPLETLARLFVLRQPIPLDDARRAVEPTRLEEWATAALLRLSSPLVEAAVELCPYRDLIAVADWPETAYGAGEPVMGIAASSRTLAEMTLRRSVGRTLDLGTGCGVLALLAAKHSAEVVAVDCNPRSIHLARQSAQLNGTTNIVFHLGDWFEPVHRQTFDLVVCNPPFVIGPGGAPVHTQSGRPADELCRAIVQTAAAYLREGGFCQLLCNWACIAGEDWRPRLAAWFQGTCCDAWVLHSHTEDAADYAMKRVLEAVEDADQISRRFNEWRAHFERQHIDAVGFGLITLRRSTKKPNWFRCDGLPEVRGPCGADIERGFALRDFLEAHRDDRQFLQARLRQAPNLKWEHSQHLSAGAWEVTRSQIRLADGLAYVVLADRAVLDFVARSTGEHRLGEVLNERAAAGGASSPVTPLMLNAVRHLVEQGFLVPMNE